MLSGKWRQNIQATNSVLLRRKAESGLSLIILDLGVPWGTAWATIS